MPSCHVDGEAAERPMVLAGAGRARRCRGWRRGSRRRWSKLAAGVAGQEGRQPGRERGADHDASGASSPARASRPRRSVDVGHVVGRGHDRRPGPEVDLGERRRGVPAWPARRRRRRDSRSGGHGGDAGRQRGRDALGLRVVDVGDHDLGRRRRRGQLPHGARPDGAGAEDADSHRLIRIVEREAPASRRSGAARPLGPGGAWWPRRRRPAPGPTTPRQRTFTAGTWSRRPG